MSNEEKMGVIDMSSPPWNDAFESLAQELISCLPSLVMTQKDDYNGDLELLGIEPRMSKQFHVRLRVLLRLFFFFKGRWCVFFIMSNHPHQSMVIEHHPFTIHWSLKVENHCFLRLLAAPNPFKRKTPRFILHAYLATSLEKPFCGMEFVTFCVVNLQIKRDICTLNYFTCWCLGTKHQFFNGGSSLRMQVAWWIG